MGMQSNQLDPKTLDKKKRATIRRWRDKLSTYRSIALQQTAQDRMRRRIGEEAFLLQWSKTD